MRTRPLEREDVATIVRLHQEAGHDFELPEDLFGALIEDAVVVEDEAGELIAFGYAQRVPEVCLVLRQSPHPMVKLQALQMVHSAMCNNLVQKGYTEAIAHVPPALEKSYGRHLVRRFGWLPSWPGFRIRRSKA